VSCVLAGVSYLVASACRRHNAIHAKVFNHLAIFIGSVNYGGGSHEYARCCAAEPGNLFKSILRGDGFCCAMTDCE
jgi:hypothetical protein